MYVSMRSQDMSRKSAVLKYRIVVAKEPKSFKLKITYFHWLLYFQCYLINFWSDNPGFLLLLISNLTFVK